MEYRTAKRAYLRTLSSNHPHPLAKEAILECTEQEAWNQCDIKICGSILSILYHNPRSFEADTGRLIIWNWKTGEELLVRSSSAPVLIVRLSIYATLGRVTLELAATPT
jgi:hypothetical protein